MKWSDIMPTEAVELGKQLAARAESERAQGAKIWPEQDKIFRALELTPPNKTRVVIVGQDPYHTPGVANGLAFSTAPGMPIPPSLKNIFKELASDIDIAEPTSGDLTSWAEHGVLLLNTSLTVYEHQANSCADWGWKDFTKAVLSAAVALPQPIVFILWGMNAQDLKDVLICSTVVEKPGGIIIMPYIKKAIIMSSHPSPFSVSRRCNGTPAFKGSQPFSKANHFLCENKGSPVLWEL